MKRPNATLIAVAAIMIAVTTVFTMIVRVPIPATQGYVNFSDLATYFAAFAFGPLIGGVAGGVGAAIAYLLSGYAEFELVTLLAHGSQGVAAGWLGRGKGLKGLIVAWAAGTLCMVGVYFLGEWLVLGMGVGAALAEAPFNLLQNVVGGVVGIPLLYAVRRAYPPIARLGQKDTWQEE